MTEIEYPDYLVKQVKERSATYQLEGFLSGQGPRNPKLMIVGKHLVKQKFIMVSRLAGEPENI